MKRVEIKSGFPLDSEIKIDSVIDFLDEELIYKLKILSKDQKLFKKYSEIYEGGVFVMYQKNNLDWISQSAHSFRDILYILKGKQNLSEYLENNFKSILDDEAEKLYKSYIIDLYNFFSDLAHHFSDTDKDFENISYTIAKDFTIKALYFTEEEYIESVKIYKKHIKYLVTTAIDVHGKIDEFISQNNKSKKASKKAKKFINFNEDSKRYFFHKMDHTWVAWLLECGFFVSLKLEAKNQLVHQSRMPELVYLINVVEEEPLEVTNVIFATKISKDNFNPEVVERFIWIMSKLPVDQLKRVVIKMKNEEWIKLMSGFRKTGYEFGSIVENLAKEDEKDGLLDLLESVLLVCDKDEKKSNSSIFYVDDIYASDIFSRISEIEKKENIFKVLKFLLKQLEKAILEHGFKYSEGESIYSYDDPFSIYDKNIFDIKIEGRHAFSFNLDESNMIALIVDLFRKVDISNIEYIAEKLNELPSSEIAWKLNLVFLTIYNEQFSEKIYTKLNSLFNYGDNYGAVFYGPEYKQAIGLVISNWSEDSQNGYVLKSIEFFKSQVESHKDQSWHLRNIIELFSIIHKSTSNNEIRNLVSKSIESDFDSNLDEDYKPEPRYKSGSFGTVNHKTPFDISEISVTQIFKNLKNEWTPEKIKEDFKDDDFLSPRSPEGLSDALRENLKNRFDEYVECMLSESSYKDIHPQYVAALLRSFEELFRSEDKSWKIEEIENILEILIKIKSQGVLDGDLSRKDDAWLATWLTVKRSISNVLLYIIEAKDKDLRKVIHQKNKDNILILLKYLFNTPESPDAKHEEPDYGDPFHVAINSVRGRVYQGFIIYLENDGKVLSDESKEFFRTALRDTSTAVRFVIGYYLPSIYYRNTEFVSELFQTIFPNDLSDKLASWEGYLNQSLYQELYKELEDYYRWAMDVVPPERKYTKDINEVLSAHIALDFVHFQESHTTGFVWDFLERKNVKQINEFITFIGRSYINSDSYTKGSLNELPGGFEKFINLWDWVIDQNLEPEAYTGFGFWINDELIDSNILIEKINKTFEVSKGAIDWDYKFEKSLVKFAEINQEKTLNIIQHYLLEKNIGSEYVLNSNRRYPIFSIDNEIKSAFKIIYNNKDLQERVKILINLLIENGGQMFWSLEDILE